MMNTTTHSAVPVAPGHRCRTCGGARGFTLVELLVALAAGLIVALAAFVMARNATRFFRYEARVAAAQYGSMVGFSRLQTDLQRAAFMSSPNVQRDPLRCGNMGDWPTSLRGLSAAHITDGGSILAHGGDHTLTQANGLQPDSIVITGGFASTEQFPARGVFAGVGGGVDIYLQTDCGAYSRTQTAASEGGRDLTAIFAPGRFLRVIDHDGRHLYGIINGFTAAPEPRISLRALPRLPRKEVDVVCGYKGMGIGVLVNPINRVRYDLRSLAADPRYQPLYTQASGVGEHYGVAAAQRTELVRVELLDDDAEDPASLELVAEYAVDLKFGLSRIVPPVQTIPPTIVREPIGAGGVYAAAGDVTLGARPEYIRALQVRLVTRSAERDRDVALVPPTGLPAGGPPMGGLYRFDLRSIADPNAGFARVRTLVADVSLQNQQRVNWP